MYAPAFERFIRPARRHPELWRLVVGMLTGIAVFLAGTAVVLAIAWSLGDRSLPPLVWAGLVVEAKTPGHTLVLLASFLPLALAAFVAAACHGRRPATLFGPRVRTLRDFGTAALVTLAVLSVSGLVFGAGFTPIQNLSFETWLTVLPFALLGLAVQTGAEELVFRGYLQQQLAARFTSPLVWMLVPTALFAAAHFDTTTLGANAWIALVAAGIFGLVAADLTAVTGSIGAAWGVHFANNTLAVTVLATDGTITGLALYRTPYLASDPELASWPVLVDFALVGLAWFVVRRLTAR